MASSYAKLAAAGTTGGEDTEMGTKIEMISTSNSMSGVDSKNNGSANDGEPKNHSAIAAAKSEMLALEAKIDEALSPSRAKIIFAIILYSLCSATLLLINKVAVESLPSVSFVLIAQFVFSVAVVKVCAIAGYIDLEPLEMTKVKQFWGVSFLFACCLFTNVKALQYANVETIIVFRSCSPIAVTILDYFLLERDLPSLRSWLALLSIVIGSILYVYFDKEFKIDSYMWTGLYYITIISEMVYVKYIISEVKMSTWTRVYYNNLLSIPFVLVFGLFFNDHIALMNHEWDIPSTASVFLSCVVGIGISYAGFNLRDLVTATSFTVIGVVNKLATTAINAMMWDKHADAYGIGALVICIAGGSLYQQSGKRGG